MEEKCRGWEKTDVRRQVSEGQEQETEIRTPEEWPSDSTGQGLPQLNKARNN